MEKDSLQIEIDQILESSKEEIRNATMSQIKEALKNNISWNLEQQIKTAVADFFKTEMEAEIKNILLDSKEEICLQIKAGIVSSCAEIAKQMVAKAEKNMKTSSWAFDDIIKKLFN